MESLKASLPEGRPQNKTAPFSGNGARPAATPKEPFTGYWFKMPGDAADLDILMQLPPAEYKVFSVVAYAVQRDRAGGLLSASQIATRAKLSERRAQEAVASLCRKGRLLRLNRATGAALTNPAEWNGRTVKYGLPIQWKQRDADNLGPTGASFVPDDSELDSKPDSLSQQVQLKPEDTSNPGHVRQGCVQIDEDTSNPGRVRQGYPGRVRQRHSESSELNTAAPVSLGGFSSSGSFRKTGPSSSGFSYSVAREETEAKRDDDEATSSQNENPTPEPAANVELPAAGEDENLPERENSKTPDLEAATVPAVTRNPEDLAALVETAREQLRMARAASMDFAGLVTTENLEATSPPDGKITVEILGAFSEYADFELWLKDTVTRGLGRKAKSARYALYLADARSEASRVTLARRAKEKRLQDIELACERQQAEEAAAVPVLDTPMPLLQAFGRIQGRLAGRAVPRPLKAKLERTGGLISPNALEAAIRGWRRCAHCDDGGTVGNVIDRTLTFCACAAGLEAGYGKGAAWPAEEIARVHADTKSLLVAAAHMVNAYLADAIEASTITETPAELVFDAPKSYRLYFVDRQFHEVLKRAGEQRTVRLTWQAVPSPAPTPTPKPEGAAAPLFKPITQADIDRELAKRQQRKPPVIEPVANWADDMPAAGGLQ